MSSPPQCLADPAFLQAAHGGLREVFDATQDAQLIMRHADDVSWAGPAANAYRQALTEISTDICRLLGVVDEAHNALFNVLRIALAE